MLNYVNILTYVDTKTANRKQSYFLPKLLTQGYFSITRILLSVLIVRTIYVDTARIVYTFSL